jgi:hypothetical protein
MDEKTRAALDVLQRSLVEQLEQVAVTRRMINQLLAMGGEPSLYPDEKEMAQPEPAQVVTIPKS